MLAKPFRVKLTTFQHQIKRFIIFIAPKLYDLFGRDVERKFTMRRMKESNQLFSDIPYARYAIEKPEALTVYAV